MKVTTNGDSRASRAKPPDKLGTHFQLNVTEGDPHWIQRRMIAFQSVANDASADLVEILEPLDAIVKHRGWEKWPMDEPYGSLDAMCLDLTGLKFSEFIGQLRTSIDRLAASAVVPTSTDSAVKPEDRTLRERVEAFALSEAANPWHRKVLTELYDLWHEWNEVHFDSKLITPLILLAEPSQPKRLGDYGSVSSIGGAGQIRIRPSLLTGTHPRWLSRPTREQCLRFSRDVLLHESIHQWQDEVLRNRERSYHGHGPKFRDKCNEIGSRLGLGPVRTCKKRGKDADLPSCSHWPHCVRASGDAGQLRWNGDLAEQEKTE